MLPRFDNKDRAGRRGGGPLEPAGMGLPRNANFAGQSRFPARRLQTNTFLRRAPQDAPEYGGTNLPQLGKRNIPSHTVSVYSAVRPSTTPYNARVLQPPNRLPPSSTQRVPEEGEAAKPVPPSKPKAPAALGYTSRPRTQGTAMMPGRMGLATPSYAPLAGSKPLPGHGRNPGYSQGGVRASYAGAGSMGPSFKPPKAKAHAPRYGYPETGPPSTAPLHTMDPHHQHQQQHPGRSLTQRELLLQRELGFNSNPRASLAADAQQQPRARFAHATPPNFGLSRGGGYGGAHTHHPTVVGSRKQRPTSARRSHRGRNPPPPSKQVGGGSHAEQTLAYARGGAGAPRPPPGPMLPSAPSGGAGGAATFHYGQQPQWPSMQIREPKQGYPRVTPKPQLQTFPPTGTKTSAAAAVAARDNNQRGGGAAETTLNSLAGAGAKGAGAGAAPVGAQRVAAHGTKPATSPSPSPGPKAKTAPVSAPVLVDDDVPPVMPSTAPLSAAPAVAAAVAPPSPPPPPPRDASPPPSPKPKAAAKAADPLEQIKLVEEVRKGVKKALREGQEDSEVLAALRSKAADSGLPPTDAVFNHLDDMAAAARVPLQRAQLPRRVLDLVPLPEDHPPVNRVLGRYELSKVVGEGAYGRVMLARDTETAEGRPVAIKEFKVSDDDPDAEEVRRTSRREVALLKMLNHPHIVKYLNEFYDQENKLFVVMEFVPRNLLEVLEAHANGLSADVVRRCMWQLCKAMCFIHKQDIVYRDIKPENLLIDPNGTLKLCDFGFARKVSSEHTVLTDYVATRWYRAPELLLGPPFRDDTGREVRSPYGKAVDMWAVGCLMGELIDGEPMFAGDSDLDQLARIQRMQGRLTAAQEALFLRNPSNAEVELLGQKEDDLSLKYGDKVDPTSLDFMRGLLVIDPKSRLTAEDALRHPYFQSLWQD